VASDRPRCLAQPLLECVTGAARLAARRGVRLADTDFRPDAGERAWRRKCWWCCATPIARGHRHLRKLLAERRKINLAPHRPLPSATWQGAPRAQYATAVAALYPCRSSALRKRQGMSARPLRRCPAFFRCREVGSPNILSSFAIGRRRRSDEARDRPVMESKIAVIHRKIRAPASQLPITESAHKAVNGATAHYLPHRIARSVRPGRRGDG